MGRVGVANSHSEKKNRNIKRNKKKAGSGTKDCNAMKSGQNIEISYSDFLEMLTAKVKVFYPTCDRDMQPGPFQPVQKNTVHVLIFTV